MQKTYNRIVLGLGSNLGDRKKYISQAVDLIVSQLELKNIRQSKILINKALLKPDAPAEWDRDFFNIAISGDINLQKFPPEKTLKITQEIEKHLGRQTNIHAIPWAPREIDIDILAINDLIIDLGEKLRIPHHALLEREFFLKPFAEIENDLLKKIINQCFPLSQHFEQQLKQQK